MKPNILKLVFTVFLAIQTCSIAVVISWNGGAEDDLWDSALNWNPDIIPTIYDDVYLNVANGQTFLYPGNSAYCRSLLGPGYTVGNHVLNLNAATLNTSTSLTYPWFMGAYAQGTGNFFNSNVTCGRIYCGFSTGGVGILNLYGGNFNSSESICLGYYAGSSGTLNLSLNGQLSWQATFYCGSSGYGQANINGTVNSTSSGVGLMIGGDAGGVGEFNVSGGDVSINGEIWVSHSGTATLTQTGGQIQAQTLYVPRTAQGNGHINLNGGDLTLENFQLCSTGGIGAVDITTGSLSVHNDRRTRILSYIKDGWITAYSANERAEIIMDYNQTKAGYTTVKAEILSDLKAYAPNPANKQKVNSQTWDGSLSFSAGENSQAHHLYIGTDFLSVENALQTSPEYVGQFSQPNCPAGTLVEGQWYYWRVDEYDGSVIHKGKTWSFKFVEPKPTIYYFDLRFTFGEDVHKQYDIRHMASCVQGIVNRKEPKVFLIYHNDDRLWLERLIEDGGLCEDWNIYKIQDVQEYLQLFGSYINGLILYDPDPTLGVMSTSLVATTAAGVESAIAVRKDNDPCSLYNYLSIDSNGPQFNTLIDLTDKFTGTGNIWQSNTVSTQSQKCDAYIWAKEKYIDTGLCDPTLLSYTLDLWGLKENANLWCQLSNLDYAVMRKGFCFELSPWGNELPNDDLGQPLGTDREVFKNILEACNDQTNKQEMIKFCGFVNFYYKYTDTVGGNYSGWETEWEMVRLISVYNAYMEGDAMSLSYISNSSFYTWFRPQLTGKRYIQNAPISYSEMQSRGLIDAGGNVPAGNYILLCLGDYDQGPWTLYQAAGQFFDDEARGQVPCNWACTPNTSDRNIAAYDYMYRNLSPKDSFIAWDSGAGYINPAQLYGSRYPSGYPNAVSMWQNHCSRYYQYFDYSISAWLLNGFEGDLTDVDAQNYLSFSPDGIGMHQTSLNTPLLIDNVPVIELTHAPDPLIDNIINHSSGVHFAQYRTIVVSPNYIKDIQDRYSISGNNHHFLDAQTFYYLLRHHLGGQNTYRTTWVSDTIPRELKIGKTYIVQISVRNDGWDTWSEDGQYRLTYAIMPKGQKAEPQHYNQNPRSYLSGGVIVETGQTHTFDVQITAPSSEGDYDLYLEMVQDSVTWFEDKHNMPYKLSVNTICNSDLNNDDKVNFQDYSMMADSWLKTNLEDTVLPVGDLIANWTMDDSITPGTLEDESGFANHGTIYGAAYTNGIKGPSLMFDGQNDYVRLVDNGSIGINGTDFTICVWICPESLPENEQGIIAKVQNTSEKEYAFSLNGSRLQLDIETAGNNGMARSTSQIVFPGHWQHIAVAYDSQSMTPGFFVSGNRVQLESNTIFGQSQLIDEDIYIGMWGGSYFSKFFHGKIDELRIYNYLLNDEEISRLANNLGLEPRIFTECTELLQGDINGDCLVDFIDLLCLTDQWLMS